MKHGEIYVNCLAFQLSLARKHVAAWYQRVLDPIGLSPVYVYVLGLLRDKGSASPSEIAEALELKRPTVTSLLDRMTRDGLISRKGHARDRRALVVKLSPKGNEICDHAYGLLKRADKSLDKALHGNLA